MKSLMPLMAATAALATALFLSACTGPASDGHTDHQHGSESADANGADVAFSTDMIVHHQQAVEMSALVGDRSTNPEVITLAENISAAQGPEIETMKTFLARWNENPGTGTDGHEGHGGMDGMEMTGMVDGATMARLESLRGPDFDRLWLQSMIAHHEGAIEMANAQIADGVNADAKTLATQIVRTQQAEIVQMKSMLGG